MSEDIFEIKDGVLVKYKGTEDKVIIPDGVTVIGQNAFASSNCSTVTIPLSVVTIDDFAFYRCHELTEINIPASVTTIGICAFFECSKLKKVNIPSSVKVLGEGNFTYCKALKNIEISPESDVCKIVDGVLYSKDGTVLLAYYGEKTERKFVIPDGVKRIGCTAFAFAVELYEVEIPDGVTEIGEQAFWHCTFLKSVSLPASVKKIENEAFSCCEFMTSVSLQEGIISIGFFAFVNCTSLREITIPYGVANMGYSIPSIDGSEYITSAAIFTGCENLTVNCVMDFKPLAWPDDWAGDAKVVWGYKGK